MCCFHTFLRLNWVKAFLSFDKPSSSVGAFVVVKVRKHKRPLVTFIASAIFISVCLLSRVALSDAQSGQNSRLQRKVGYDLIVCCPHVVVLNNEQHCFILNASLWLILPSRRMMSRLVGVRSVQRSLFHCDARLNSLCRMSTWWTVSSEGVKAVVLAVFSGFEWHLSLSLAMIFIIKIERHQLHRLS